MTVQQGKQLVKNALYRSIGETSAALRLVPNGAASLRILMYHKVNDIPDNPTTVPVGRFDDQLAQLTELGYEVVGLEAVREIAVSTLRLEEELGRPVRAYAYVQGSEAHFHPVHESLLKQAGYDIAFTSISRANGAAGNPFRLGRYNVEPYPRRTFELVLAGACDLIALKDTVAGTHARRLFNAALGTSTK